MSKYEVNLTTSDLDSSRDFAGVTITAQFQAIEEWIDFDSIVASLKTSQEIKNLISRPPRELEKVEGWLGNVWSTEKLLRINKRDLSDQGLSQAVHWAFPQAYYALYNCLSAFLSAKGAGTSNHAKTCKAFGTLVKQGKYPDSVSFLATGNKKSQQFTKITDHGKSTPTDLDIADRTTVSSIICSHLRATRRIDCNNMRENRKSDFKTQKGKIKERLTEEDWDSVARSVGPTSLMSIMYRHRVKSNYREVDSLLSQDLDASKVHSGLIHIVECVNYIHECYLIALMGKAEVLSIFESQPVSYKGIKSRLEHAADTVAVSR